MKNQEIIKNGFEKGIYSLPKDLKQIEDNNFIRFIYVNKLILCERKIKRFINALLTEKSKELNLDIEFKCYNFFDLKKKFGDYPNAILFMNHNEAGGICSDKYIEVYPPVKISKLNDDELFKQNTASNTLLLNSLSVIKTAYHELEHVKQNYNNEKTLENFICQTENTLLNLSFIKNDSRNNLHPYLKDYISNMSEKEFNQTKGKFNDKWYSDNNYYFHIELLANINGLTNLIADIKKYGGIYTPYITYLEKQINNLKQLQGSKKYQDFQQSLFNEITKSQTVDSLLAHSEDNEVYLKLLTTVAMRENRFDDPLIVKGIEEEIERVNELFQNCQNIINAPYLKEKRDHLKSLINQKTKRI